MSRNYSARFLSARTSRKIRSMFHVKHSRERPKRMSTFCTWRPFMQDASWEASCWFAVFAVLDRAQKKTAEAVLFVIGYERGYFAAPIRQMVVPQSGHLPFVMGLPFLVRLSTGSFISFLALHFTQYASIAMAAKTPLCSVLEQDTFIPQLIVVLYRAAFSAYESVLYATLERVPRKHRVMFIYSSTTP